VAGLPVGSVSVSGSDITVSHLLNNPRIIDRRLGEAVNYRYWADQLLPNVGAPGGGVVIYEEWSPIYSVLDREAEDLAPDAEVPLAGSVEGDLKIVKAVVDGLGYVVTREMENRNARFLMDRKERGLANSMADKFNAKAVAVINAAISASSRTYAATDWSALVTDGADPDPKANWPHGTLALIQAQQQEDRIPFTFDGMLAHPLDVWRLSTIYQLDGNTSLASKLGLSTIITDNTGDVPHGSPILFSSGNVGGTAWEEPIKTEVIPEPRRRRKVVQTTGSAAYFVDNPYALLQLTGVAAADLAA
jgi:hypothetical protein